jgi:nucleoside-diphosphate-sugar epimerase
VDIISRHVADISVQHVDTRIMNQLSYHVSNKRLRDLGFKFEGDLEQGIGKTIDLLKGVRQEHGVG